MTKRVLIVLGVVGLLALSAKEFPSLLCEIKIWRMGNAPGGV